MRFSKIFFSKTITLTAFILHSGATVYFTLFFFKLLPMLKALETPINIYLFALIFIIPLVFAVGSLLFYFYLRKKTQKQEEAKFAIWISIFWLLTIFVSSFLVNIVLVFPMHKMLEQIK